MRGRLFRAASAVRGALFALLQCFPASAPDISPAAAPFRPGRAHTPARPIHPCHTLPTLARPVPDTGERVGFRLGSGVVRVGPGESPGPCGPGEATLPPVPPTSRRLQPGRKRARGGRPFRPLRPTETRWRQGPRSQERGSHALRTPQGCGPQPSRLLLPPRRGPGEYAGSRGVVSRAPRGLQGLTKRYSFPLPGRVAEPAPVSLTGRQAKRPTARSAAGRGRLGAWERRALRAGHAEEGSAGQGRDGFTALFARCRRTRARERGALPNVSPRHPGQGSAASA